MSAPTVTLTEPAPVPSEAAREGHRFRAVLALARFEARELLLQVPLLLTFVLYVGYVALRLMDRDGMDAYPVLNTVDRQTQTEPLLFAVAVFICCNAAALRSRKANTVQQFGVLAMEPWRRTLAHVLSVVPYAALTALVAAGEFGREALKPGAIGHGSVGELAVGPLTVLLAGVLGVLLALVLPSTFIPILVAIPLYVLFVAASVARDAGRWEGWLSPVLSVAQSGGDPVPSDLLGRPAGWHALYVTGLCAVLACAALLRAGARTRLVTAATVLALAVTVTGAVGQFPRDAKALDAARRTAADAPRTVQSCERHGLSTYCSFAEWSGVRSDWAEVVDRVRSAAGGTAATARLTVRQRVYIDDQVEVDGALDPSSTRGEVTVGTRWGGNRVPEFAVGAAVVLVGGSEDMTRQELCDDARAVTVMWLVLSTDPTPTATFRHVRLGDSLTGPAQVLAPTEGLSLTGPQTTVIRELLERPRAAMTARVKAHWAQLTSASTTTAQAARLLGVEVPKEAEKCEE
ncbi:ABC transporter permease [Streptomyces hilarionis]|uniref:ABC transporter permease n=1 Tax=Streptomyces hilarionis TaxID=2839954 RepID=UPI002119BF75|nr:ABC transporter permease [Streptomyces hilarionis]MCQ9133273.1 ABC transporter permease [Streptomyces hilarionis]